MKPAAGGPESILVIGKTFAVEDVDKVDDEDSSGEQRRDQQLIKVKAGQHPETLRETLLHELIHAIEEQLGLDMKERQVHSLAIGLFQVLRENPALVRFVTATTTKGSGRK